MIKHFFFVNKAVLTALTWFSLEQVLRLNGCNL